MLPKQTSSEYSSHALIKRLFRSFDSKRNRYGTLGVEHWNSVDQAHGRDSLINGIKLSSYSDKPGTFMVLKEEVSLTSCALFEEEQFKMGPQGYFTTDGALLALVFVYTMKVNHCRLANAMSNQEALSVLHC